MADRARRGALVLLALLAIVSLGCARPGLSSHPSQKQRAPVQSTKLDNGLTLTVQQDKSVPLVTLDMWVRVGGGDEPAEMAGVSHFLEHMLFKGTERLAVGEYDKRIEEVGGYLNAATSLDYTHYFVTIPSQHFDRVLEDFSDVLLHSSLDPAEVEGERQVILEEISRKIDNPFSYLFDETIPALFEAGPYTHPVIGSRESVTGMTREQLFAHYRRFYTPDNMFLSVVGDVDPAEARAKVAKAFGAADAKLTPWREKPPGDGVPEAGGKDAADGLERGVLHHLVRGSVGGHAGADGAARLGGDGAGGGTQFAAGQCAAGEAGTGQQHRLLLPDESPCVAADDLRDLRAGEAGGGALRGLRGDPEADR
jgi:hypothetical protein